MNPAEDKEELTPLMTRGQEVRKNQRKLIKKSLNEGTESELKLLASSSSSSSSSHAERRRKIDLQDQRASPSPEYFMSCRHAKSSTPTSTSSSLSTHTHTHTHTRGTCLNTHVQDSLELVGSRSRVIYIYRSERGGEVPWGEACDDVVLTN